MTFDPGLSPLTKDPDLVQRLIQRLEEELHEGIKIVGVLEIGSFAKHEAVPQSDSDLRIYCESPEGIVWQTGGSRHFNKIAEQLEQQFDRLSLSRGNRKRLYLNWMRVNKPLQDKLSEELGVNVEFGFADYRFCNFQMEEMDAFFCPEHQYIIGSIIHHDPDGFLLRWREQTMCNAPQPFIDLLQERFLDSPPFELYTHLEPHRMDDYKIHKCLQLQWVKWAVFAIRGAISSKWYLEFGQYPYRAPEVISIVEEYFPAHLEFVKEMYRWKVYEETRFAMCRQYVAYPKDTRRLFARQTKKIEAFVQAVNELDLSSPS